MGEQDFPDTSELYFTLNPQAIRMDANFNVEELNKGVENLKHELEGAVKGMGQQVNEFWNAAAGQDFTKGFEALAKDVEQAAANFFAAETTPTETKNK